jgi:hypothetical protein
MIEDVKSFIDEATRPGGRTQSSVLYDAYREFVTGKGIRPASPNEFYNELAHRGYPSRKSGGVMVRDLSLLISGVLPDDVDAVQTWLDGEPVATVKPDGSTLPTVDELAAQYCERGANMTAREVAEHFGVSDDWVRDTLKAEGITKKSAPFSDATFEATDVDELVTESLAMKRHLYKIKADRAERREWQNRAIGAETALAALRRDRETLASWCRMAVMDVAPAEIEPPRYSDTGTAYHAVVADPHVGLQVYGKEAWTGENYHTDIAADRIVDAARRAGSWVDSMRGVLGAPRVIHYSILGDLAHAQFYATVSGRPMQVDGRSRRVFEKIVNACATAISTLAQVSPVEARLTDGNHDGDIPFYVATALAAYFREVPHVNVSTSYNHQCSFFEGETLHVLDHGRTVTALESKTAHADMATVVREIGEMYPPHRRAKVWLGDKHSGAGAWHGRHTELIRVPALASTDDYAQGINYVHDYDAYVYSLTERGGIGNVGRLYE